MPDDGGVDEELAPSASSKFYLNNAPYTARIKRMMQSDEDVGRVAKATPILICECGRRVTLRCSRWGGPAVPALEPGFCTAWQDARAKGSTGATPDAARPTAAGCGRETAVPGQTPQAPTHPTTAAKALDVFLANLVEGAVRLAQERGAKALTAAHMCVARMAVSGDAPWPAPALPGRRGACADAHTAPLLDGRWCRAVPVWPGTREGMPVSEGMREGARPPAPPPACRRAVERAGRGLQRARSLAPRHAPCRKAHIQSDPLLDFCLEAVAGVADLPSLEECALQSPKASRKRAK